MARLSAHGSILAKFVKREVHTDDSLNWSKDTIAVMSDMVVLTKRDVEFKPLYNGGSPSKHSYGWKNTNKKVKEGHMDSLRANLLKLGYEEFPPTK